MEINSPARRGQKEVDRLQRIREDIMGLEQALEESGSELEEKNWEFWVRVTNGRNLYLIFRK